MILFLSLLFHRGLFLYFFRMDPNHFYQDRLKAAKDDGRPLVVENLDPMHCQNNGCSKPLRGPIKQVIFILFSILFYSLMSVLCRYI
jgi:hypothetical protein